MSRKAVLIIHGFMADMKEVEYLSNTIKNNSNIDVYSFTLPGHDKAILKAVKYEDWIKYSQEMLDTLKPKYKTIYLVGHSMGGVISTYLAAKNKEVKKLVLVAPSFIYLKFNENINLLKEKLKNTPQNRKRYKEVAQRIFTSSLSSMIEFRKLVKKYYDTPKEVTCPILIIQGEKDAVTPIKSSKYVYDNVRSEKKHLKIIKDANHGLLYDYKKENVSKYICNYLKGGLLWIITKNLKI